MAGGTYRTVEWGESEKGARKRKRTGEVEENSSKRATGGTPVGEAGCQPEQGNSGGCSGLGCDAAFTVPQRQETAKGEGVGSEPLLGEGNVQDTVAWLESCLDAEVVRWNSEVLHREAAEAAAAAAVTRATKAEAEITRLRQVLAKKGLAVGEALAVAEEANERAEEAEKRAVEAKIEVDAAAARVELEHNRARGANKRAEEASERADEANKRCEDAKKGAGVTSTGKVAKTRGGKKEMRSVEAEREINELSRQLADAHQRAEKAENELVEVGKQREEACKKVEEADRRAREADEKKREAKTELEAAYARVRKEEAKAEEAVERAAELGARSEEADKRAKEADKKGEEADQIAKEAIAKATAIERALADEVARRARAETGHAVAKANADRLAKELDTVVASFAANGDTAIVLKKEATRMRLLLFERNRSMEEAVRKADEADVRAETEKARAEEARRKAEEAAWRADDADIRAADMERLAAEEVARRLRAESGESLARRKAEDLAKQLEKTPRAEQLEANYAVAKVKASALETELAGMRSSLVEKIEEVANAREEEANARRRKAETRVAVLEFARAEEVSRRERAESAAAKAETRADELTKKLEERTVRTEKAARSQEISSEEATSGQSDGEVELFPYLALVETRLAAPASQKAVAMDTTSDGGVSLDAELVGRRVGIWWPVDGVYYKGRFVSFTRWNTSHEILYDDGSKEFLDLAKERWKLLETEDESEEETERELIKKTSASGDRHKKSSAKLVKCGTPGCLK